MATQYFRMVSDPTMIQRRSFELSDPTILDPNTTNPLLEGEWLKQAATDYKVERGSGDGGADEPAWLMWAERGRYETQAIQKVPLLWLGDFEAETKIFTSTGLTTNGQALMVSDVSVGGQNKRGLLLRTSTNYIVARVTRLPSVNNGWLRFITTRN